MDRTRRFLVSATWSTATGAMCVGTRTLTMTGDKPLDEECLKQMTEEIEKVERHKDPTLKNFFITGWSEFDAAEDSEEKPRWILDSTQPQSKCPKCGAQIEKYLAYQYRYCPLCGVRLHKPEG